MQRQGTMVLFFIIVILTLATDVTPSAVAASNAPSASKTSAISSLDGLDTFITDVMQEWGVPGLAIAVVRDGEVVLSKGYGFRHLYEPQLPVTPRTLFAIGSITKSFTVTGLGMLADEGKLDWDTPVREYLPDFRLYDAVASKHMTARDLLTHRSGLPRHDLLWFGGSFNREELFTRLRYLEPTKNFRGNFQYQNLMYMTGGYLIGKIAETSWEEFTRQRILTPLGMEHSNFSVNDSQKASNFAKPYTLYQEEAYSIPFRNIDAMGPAGSINSNVEEMIRYVQFHIDKGQHGGKRLLSTLSAMQMQTPQMVIPGKIKYDELGHKTYGLGFFVSTYRGHKLVEHSGGIDGFTALLSFLPRKKMGIIVLTNLSRSRASKIIIYNVYDRLLGLEPLPWVERFKKEKNRRKDRIEARKEARRQGYTIRKNNTTPTHPLADYTGTYEHRGYGQIRIDVEGKDLNLTFQGETMPLRHFHYDIYVVRRAFMRLLSGLKITFLYNKNGEIERLTIPLQRGMSDIVFTRRANVSMRERPFLEPFVGEYDLGFGKAKVFLRGNDTLTYTFADRATHELIPTRGSSFDLKDLHGYSIEFQRQASGVVNELVIFTPRGAYIGEKKGE